MIELRVDDRLVHGQVVLLWTKHLDTDGIIVANDKAGTDEIQQMTLKMAVPSGTNILIRTVSEAEKLLKDPRIEKMNILVLVNCIEDAYNICENNNIDRVNIANSGRFDGSSVKEKKKLFSTVYVNQTEEKYLEKLLKIHNNVVHQISPDDAVERIGGK